MKKIYVILAVAALVLSAASCGNAQEEVAAEPTAAEEVKEAVTDAAVDVAKEAVAAGAEAVKDEIKK